MIAARSLAVATTLGAILVAAAFAVEPPRRTDMPAPTTLHDGKVPVGSLGKPLGTYVTITGTRYPHNVRGAQWVLRVEEVDGKTLPKPVTLWIDNIGRLPKGQRIVLKGFESARMVGVPPAYATASREDNETPPAWTQRHDVKWQMELFFTVLKTVSLGEK